MENRTFRAGDVDVMSDGLESGTVHLTAMSTIVAYALSRGVTAADITETTGFELATLGDPDARVSDDVAHRLWNMLVAAFPDVPVTLEAAKAAPFSTLGGLTHGMQYASTLREAVAFSKRNAGVLADRLELTVDESESEVRVISVHPADKLDDGCMAEMCTCLVARFFREVLGLKNALLRVDLTHAPRGPHYDYEAHFLCPVHFRKDANALVVRPEMLDAPIRMADPTLFSFVERHFEILRFQIETARSGHGLQTLRRAITDSAAAGAYQIDAVVSRAGLSRRNAQRLAAAHGTTLIALIEESRQKNAEAFLSDSSVSVEMAASLLGYSDDRAFRRAFKRWTGQTPSSFRKSNLSP
ncbi:MAG: AraC family transcriptional regulator ligand-binding domain-containing protein [Pseudomonadota bacterium]